MPAPASGPRGHAGRRLDAPATKVRDGCGLMVPKGEYDYPTLLRVTTLVRCASAPRAAGLVTFVYRPGPVAGEREAL